MNEHLCIDALKVSAPSAPVDDGRASRASLAKIFARVLRQPRVGEDDDFFDLGGDSILAVTLMAEIQKFTGQDLPITSIYEAPTPRAIGLLLAAGAQQRDSCLVLLKPGAQDTPLFIAHGLGGSVMELRELARRVDAKQAIYGVEARGLDGGAEPFDRIEDMARFHVDEVTRAQPDGPYYLAGYSFGGLVALEMARILSEAGNKVALLVLIDTCPHSKFWTPWCRLAGLIEVYRAQASSAVWSRLVRHYAATLKKMSFKEAASFLFSRAGRAARIPFNVIGFGSWVHRFKDPNGIETAANLPARASLPIALQRVQDAGDVALASYRPSFYPGEITFIQSEDAVPIAINARLLWGRKCGNLIIHKAPGNHFTLVRKDLDPVADILSTCLRATSAPTDSGWAP